MNLTAPHFFAFLNLGGGEVFVIALVVLLLFGSKRIPEIAQGLGKGMRQMKDAMSGVQSELKNEMNKVEQEVKQADEMPKGLSGKAEEKPREEGV